MMTVGHKLVLNFFGPDHGPSYLALGDLIDDAIRDGLWEAARLASEKADQAEKRVEQHRAEKAWGTLDVWWARQNEATIITALIRKVSCERTGR